jgi:DNA-binding transcriptional LysR family regulator
MEMAQLEFFLRVIEEKSFSKAADRVCRTQPAISIAIRRLEEEVGAPLLDRSQKMPVLTEAGEMVYEYARRIIELRDQARHAVAELRALQIGRVRIGANESTSLYLLPDLILQFRAEHPQIKVEIYRQPSDRLPREVTERNVDFALMAYEPADRDLVSFPVLTDELALIMPVNHPLAGRSAVDLEELGTEQFLAHNVKSASRNKVVETFEASQTPLNITLELATIETIKRFVRHGLGLAIVPRMCVTEELERGLLATVPINGLSYTRTLWATHRRGMTFSHAAQAFLDLLRAYAQRHTPLEPAQQIG